MNICESGFFCITLYKLPRPARLFFSRTKNPTPSPPNQFPKIHQTNPLVIIKTPPGFKKHDRLFATKRTKIAAVGPPQVPQEENKKCVKKKSRIYEEEF